MLLFQLLVQLEDISAENLLGLELDVEDLVVLNGLVDNGFKSLDLFALLFDLLLFFLDQFYKIVDFFGVYYLGGLFRHFFISAVVKVGRRRSRPLELW